MSKRIRQALRVKATDDVQVTRVAIVVTYANRIVLEQGNASPDEWHWWTYKTTVSTNGRRLKITAQDRPGHTAQASNLLLYL